MSEVKQHFHHVFIDNQVPQTLFLLHGTGGDERDLLPLAQPLQSAYNLVGLRGNVSEDGLARFFVRTAAGQFDQESIKREAHKLMEFIQDWYESHELTADEAAFVGYSNGANMILATLFLYPRLISRAALLHPMLPFQPPELDLADKVFLVTYGQQDRLILPHESQAVVKTLAAAQAEVKVFTHEGGHEINRTEAAALAAFLTRN